MEHLLWDAASAVVLIDTAFLVVRWFRRRGGGS